MPLPLLVRFLSGGPGLIHGHGSRYSFEPQRYDQRTNYIAMSKGGQREYPFVKSTENSEKNPCRFYPDSNLSR